MLHPSLKSYNFEYLDLTSYELKDALIAATIYEGKKPMLVTFRVNVDTDSISTHRTMTYPYLQAYRSVVEKGKGKGYCSNAHINAPHASKVDTMIGVISKPQMVSFKKLRNFTTEALQEGEIASATKAEFGSIFNNISTTAYVIYDGKCAKYTSSVLDRCIAPYAIGEIVNIEPYPEPEKKKCNKKKSNFQQAKELSYQQSQERLARTKKK